MTGTVSRCLVVVRAGDASLHPTWTDDLATRGFDLVVSYFGKDPSRYRGEGERRIDDAGQKFLGLHALLTRESFWRDYDYIWLPDDDLAIDQASIGEMFATAARLGLSLAQPALAWDSYYSHRITLAHPSFAWRLTNYVEVMAPCFARPFLERCLPTFTENLSGWGLDLLWPRMLPARPRSIAILDDVVMTHTRPVGGPGHDRLRAAGVSPQEESEALMAKHGIVGDVRALVYAGVDHDGRTIDASTRDGRAALRDMLAQDHAAFARAVAQNIIVDGNARSTSAR